ncbi:MAG: response regulator [Chloroflexi bacterium]|nr:response regulator [Chloroflexota bacterium]
MKDHNWEYPLNDRAVRILLIDDDEDDYILFRDLFGEPDKKRFAIEWAPTYQAGVEALLTRAFDVILVDYSLGGRSGVDLIREASPNCRCPFILVTGHSSYELDLEAMQAGALDFLNKAELTCTVLERSIRYAIQQKHTMNQLSSANDALAKANHALLKSRQELTQLLQVSEKVLAERTVKEVLQIIVDAGCSLTGARIGTSWYGLTDGKFQVGACSRGLNIHPLPCDFVQQIENDGVHMDLLHSTPSIRLTQQELLQYPAWWDLPRDHVPLNGLLGVRLVNVHNEPSGLIMVSDKSEGEFTAEDEAILAQLAALASLSLQHIEARQAAEQSAAQAKEIAAELEAIFNSISDAVIVFDEKGEAVRTNPAARRLIDLNPIEMTFRDLVNSLEVKHGEFSPLVLTDFPSKANMLGQQARGERYKIRTESGESFDFFTTASPIHDSDGKIKGVVSVWHDVTELERSVRRQLELEEENLRLEDRQIQHLAQMEVQRCLLEHREMERQQIARDLHDGPVQELLSLVFATQAAISLTEDKAVKDSLLDIRCRAQKLVNDLRAFYKELRPPTLVKFGLAQAISSHAEEFNSKFSRLKLDLNLMEDNAALPNRVRLALYRIYQESLTNIVRHSRADQVKVSLLTEDCGLVLEIQDNGKGFEPTSDWVALARHGHLGLVGMKERAEAIGGVLSIQSNPGKGTKIRVTVPWGSDN